jgi:hypothetical protein
MTRDDVLAQLQDELRGLLMESFAQTREGYRASDAELAKFGRTAYVQMQRGASLFERIVNVAKLPAGEVKEPPAPVQPAQPKPVASQNGNGAFNQPRRAT